ncbi:MAG: prepilin-type N-terminal cleavage/methylation domain-containing protein [Deltaproteobacteria bacterium]|jgi:type IV pilus assembly protein PilV|nr:prepilin-type N-terminal cleavage/methylation domain-containing protein [Deltaproteobacteria bacterium]
MIQKHVASGQAETRSGFTLIEILVALVVILLGFMASLTIITGSVKSGKMAENQTMAVFLAEAKMESYRGTDPSSTDVTEYFDRFGNASPASAERFFTRKATVKRQTPTQFSNEVEVSITWPGAEPVVFRSVFPIPGALSGAG